MLCRVPRCSNDVLFWQRSFLRPLPNSQTTTKKPSRQRQLSNVFIAQYCYAVQECDATEATFIIFSLATKIT